MLVNYLLAEKYIRKSSVADFSFSIYFPRIWLDTLLVKRREFIGLLNTNSSSYIAEVSDCRAARAFNLGSSQD